MKLGDVLDDGKAEPRPAKRTAPVLVDILNAYERVRAYYLNIAETLAGGKGN